MATQEEFRSLTEEIQYVSENMGDAARPDDVYSAAEQMEIAISDGFEGLEDAISNVGSSLQPATNVENIEQQVESVVSQQIESSGINMLKEGLAESSEVESSGGENFVNKLKERLQGLGEEAAGMGQVKEDLAQLDSAVSQMAGSANASEQNISKLKAAFGEFREGVEGVSESVMEGDASLEQAQSTITELATQVDEEFSDLVGEEGFEGAIEMLRESSSTFVENFKEASEAAKEVQMQQQGQFGQQFVQVGGAVSEIGGGELTFLQTFQSRIADISSILTKETDKIKQTLGTALAEGLENAEGDLEGVETTSGAIATRFKTVASNISAARVALAGILTPLAIGLDLLEDTYNVARDFREETGIGAERMREIRRQTAMTSSELAEFGLDPSAFGEIAGTLREEFGSVETAIARTGAATQRELTTQVGALAEGFALSASEAATLQANLTRIEEATGISSRQLAQQTRELAMQNDVAPQAAIQDIAENSSQVAKFSGQSASGLAEAAVRAQELGVNLEKVASFQEGVLTDITGTVEGLQKASMLTGQQLNSTALIEASYQGQEEALNELEAQLSGINLENLNPFARMSLEDAIPGMNFEDIQSLIEGRRELDKLNTQAERTQAMLEGDVSFKQVITEDSVDEVAQLSRSFNTLYFVIAEELFPVISDLTQAVIPALTATLKFVRPLLEGIAEGVRLILSPLQLLTGDFKGFGETIREAVRPFRNLFGMMEEGEKKANKLAAAGKALAITFATYFTGSKIISSIQGITGSLTEMLPALTKASGSFNSFAENMDLAKDVANQNISSFGDLRSSFTSLIPSIQRVKAGFRLARSGIKKFVFTTIPSLIPSLTGIQTAMYSAASSTYAFAASLTATGIGGIILGVAAAGTALYYAFEDVNSAITFATSFFNSFVEELFGVENAASRLMSALESIGSVLYDWTIVAFQKLGSFLSPIIDGVGKMTKGFFGAKTAGEALGSSLGLIFETLFDPLVDGARLIGQTIDLFYDLGAAIAQGSWRKAASALLEGVVDIGGAFVDFLIPYNLEEIFPKMINAIFGVDVRGLLQSAMNSVTSYIASFFPRSPVERGPLTALSSVGEAMIDLIFGGGMFSFAAEKMMQLGSVILDVAREAFDAAIQPMQTAFSYLIDPFVDIIGYVTELTELFYDLGAAVVQGNFSDIGGILLEGIGDLGTSMLEVLFPPGIEGMVIEKVTSLASYLRDGIGNLIDSVSNVGENLIRSIVPDSVLQFVGEKMDAVASTIRSYLPFSPAEEGPLAKLDMVGEALIDTIFGDNVYDFVSQKISQLTSVISDGIMKLGEGILNVLGIGGGEEQQSAAAPTPEAAEASKFSIQNATISVSSADINFANAQQEASSRLTSVVSEEEITTRNIEQNAFSDSLISSQSISQQFDSSNQTFSSEQFIEEFSSSFNSEQIEGDTVEIESPEIQPQSPDVATPDSSVVTAPQQAQSFQTQQQTEINEQTDEIRLDSSEDDIEAVLNEILNTQRQFLQELRDGNIAVYLDGRKVNNEMLRSV